MAEKAGHTGKPIEILLVEDSPTDAMLTREALEFSKVVNTMHHVEDGMQAMAFLRKEGPYADKLRPGLVLLDLNMPRKSGREVLQEMKSDPSLRSIPDIVLTTSKAEEDIMKSYGLHANCYVIKPVEFPKLAEVVKAIHDFWFSIVALPPEKP
jgi:CheY-like chemotaxis protein